MNITPLEKELLLSHVLQKPREWVFAHPEIELTEEQNKEYEKLVERRKNHEPIAYIINEKEFYGRKFYVDNRVLIPRPSTETLIDEVKRLFETGLKKQRSIKKADNEIIIFTEIFENKLPSKNDGLLISEIGTGSGCIGITLALEIPDIEIICTDISKDALEVAKQNAKTHNVLNRIKFIKSDLIESNHGSRPADRYLIVSNPPYIPQVDSLQPDVYNFEPHQALFAGRDGSDLLTKLHKQCLDDPNCIGCIMEMREEQAKKLTQ
jgi:release factor glutamine methyltransferase